MLQTGFKHYIPYLLWFLTPDGSKTDLYHKPLPSVINWQRMWMLADTIVTSPSCILASAVIKDSPHSVWVNDGGKQILCSWRGHLCCLPIHKVCTVFFTLNGNRLNKYHHIHMSTISWRSSSVALFWRRHNKWEKWPHTYSDLIKSSINDQVDSLLKSLWRVKILKPDCGTGSIHWGTGLMEGFSLSSQAPSLPCHLLLRWNWPLRLNEADFHWRVGGALFGAHSMP